ncbi:hypothetical protein [Borreliella burgdorferi]|nr:hypothetical protein [Borreliella burgdorferi]MDO7256839.1 hypothetical protein [Borreliella burgdorferi]MDO7279510.1 hypothetical protein [Borreliella burgdorferi]
MANTIEEGLAWEKDIIEKGI